MDDTSMIKRTILVPMIVAIALMLTACAAAPRPPQHGGLRAPNTVTLCNALSAITAGQRQPVTISGVFVVGPESQVLYDPSETICSFDVQPSTWIEFAPGVHDDRLDQIMSTRRPFEETRRAYVTFRGDLLGPGVLGADDPSLATPLAFANRSRNRRYGHLNGYRTKLVVNEVFTVKSVPPSAPWPTTSTPTAAVLITRAEVPRYPELARNSGITGVVMIDVTVSGGEVMEGKVRSGDRMLADDALRNVKSWQFAPGTNMRFTTTFTYEVERRSSRASREPRVELQLPSWVHITAPSNDW
jgi:TonB family protein